MDYPIDIQDPFTIDQLAKVAREMRDGIGHGKVLLLDLGRVTTMDIAALQLLIAMRKECAVRGQELTVTKSECVSRRCEELGIAL